MYYSDNTLIHIPTILTTYFSDHFRKTLQCGLKRCNHPSNERSFFFASYCISRCDGSSILKKIRGFLMCNCKNHAIKYEKMKKTHWFNPIFGWVFRARETSLLLVLKKKHFLLFSAV